MFRYEAAVAADLARKAAAPPAPNALAEPTNAGPQVDDQDEIQRAIAMSLAETNDSPPLAAAGIPVTAQDISANHPELGTPAEDSSPAPTGEPQEY